MTQIRISYVEYDYIEYDNGTGLHHPVDYTPMWKNFTASIWTDDKRPPSSGQMLDTEYNAFIEDNDIVFATEEDAVRFILRWS